MRKKVIVLVSLLFVLVDMYAQTFYYDTTTSVSLCLDCLHAQPQTTILEHHPHSLINNSIAQNVPQFHDSFSHYRMK